MEIANGRVRLAQPQIVTLVDYNSGRFTLMNPAKEYFWTGTVDEYVGEMQSNRKRNMSNQGYRIKPDTGTESDGDGGNKVAAPKPIGGAKLPPISITDTGIKEQIAGFQTAKYEIRADGELFQEVWIAPTLDVSSDLNFTRYLAEQRKLSAAMMGKSAGPYNALYSDPQYQQLLEKALALKVVTHHLAGGFERVATSFQPAEVPASQFEVPESYRRVRLADVMPAPPPQPARPGKGS